MPDNFIYEEGEEDTDEMVTEYVIPGLPFLSKNLAIGGGAITGGKLERDVRLYDKKAKSYLEKIVSEARLMERTELNIPDPLVFWLAQVQVLDSVLNCSFYY